MRKPQPKKTQEDILWQILERIELLSNDVRSLIATKAEEADALNDGDTDSAETEGSGGSENNFEYFTTGGTHCDEHTYVSVSQRAGAIPVAANVHVPGASSTPAGKRTKTGTPSITLANQTFPNSSAHPQKQSALEGASKSFTQRQRVAPTNSAILGLSSPNVYRAMTPQEARISNATDVGPFYLSTHGLRPGVYMNWTELADDNTRVRKPIWKRIDGKVAALAMYEQAYNEGRCRTLPPVF